MSLPSWGPLPWVKPGPAVDYAFVFLKEDGRERTRERSKRGSVEPAGVAPSGDEVACGSSGPLAFPLECLASLRFDFRFSLTHIDKQARAPLWDRALLCPVPFAGREQLWRLRNP